MDSTNPLFQSIQQKDRDQRGQIPPRMALPLPLPVQLNPLSMTLPLEVNGPKYLSTITNPSNLDTNLGGLVGGGVAGLGPRPHQLPIGGVPFSISGVPFGPGAEQNPNSLLKRQGIPPYNDMGLYLPPNAMISHSKRQLERGSKESVAVGPPQTAFYNVPGTFAPGHPMMPVSHYNLLCQQMNPQLEVARYMYQQQSLLEKKKLLPSITTSHPHMLFSRAFGSSNSENLERFLAPQGDPTGVEGRRKPPVPSLTEQMSQTSAQVNKSRPIIIQSKRWDRKKKRRGDTNVPKSTQSTSQNPQNVPNRRSAESMMLTMANTFVPRGAMTRFVVAVLRHRIYNGSPLEIVSNVINDLAKCVCCSRGSGTPFCPMDIASGCDGDCLKYPNEHCRRIPTSADFINEFTSGRTGFNALGLNAHQPQYPSLHAPADVKHLRPYRSPWYEDELVEWKHFAFGIFQFVSNPWILSNHTLAEHLSSETSPPTDEIRKDDPEDTFLFSGKVLTKAVEEVVSTIETPLIDVNYHYKNLETHAAKPVSARKPFAVNGGISRSNTTTNTNTINGVTGVLSGSLRPSTVDVLSTNRVKIVNSKVNFISDAQYFSSAHNRTVHVGANPFRPKSRMTEFLEKRRQEKMEKEINEGRRSGGRRGRIGRKGRGSEKMFQKNVPKADNLGHLGHSGTGGKKKRGGKGVTEGVIGPQKRTKEPKPPLFDPKTNILNFDGSKVVDFEAFKGIIMDSSVDAKNRQLSQMSQKSGAFGRLGGVNDSSLTHPYTGEGVFDWLGEPSMLCFGGVSGCSGCHRCKSNEGGGVIGDGSGGGTGSSNPPNTLSKTGGGGGLTKMGITAFGVHNMASYRSIFKATTVGPYGSFPRPTNPFSSASTVLSFFRTSTGGIQTLSGPSITSQAARILKHIRTEDHCGGFLPHKVANHPHCSFRPTLSPITQPLSTGHLGAVIADGEYVPNHIITPLISNASVGPVQMKIVSNDVLNEAPVCTALNCNDCLSMDPSASIKVHYDTVDGINNHFALRSGPVPPNRVPNTPVQLFEDSCRAPRRSELISGVGTIGIFTRLFKYAALAAITDTIRLKMGDKQKGKSSNEPPKVYSEPQKEVLIDSNTTTSIPNSPKLIPNIPNSLIGMIGKVNPSAAPPPPQQRRQSPPRPPSAVSIGIDEVERYLIYKEMMSAKTLWRD